MADIMQQKQGLRRWYETVSSKYVAVEDGKEATFENIVIGIWKCCLKTVVYRCEKHHAPKENNRKKF